jgi:hypothetical protein
MKFPLSTAFTVSQTCDKLCFHFHLIVWFLKFSLYFFSNPLNIQKCVVQSPCFCVCSVVCLAIGVLFYSIVVSYNIEGILFFLYFLRLNLCPKYNLSCSQFYRLLKIIYILRLLVEIYSVISFFVDFISGWHV